MFWSTYNFWNDKINQCCILLEFFHPYKRACEVIWRRAEFFGAIFGPLYHLFHPNSVIPSKPRLKSIECFFTLLRLVYPKIRDTFAAQITKNKKARQYLITLQVLF